MRKSWLAGLALALGLAGTAAAQEKVVKVYNWSDYIDPSVLERLHQAKTGIKVVYDVYDTNEMLETKLLAGGSGYDLVVPSDPLPGAADPGRASSPSSTSPRSRTRRISTRS